MKSNSEFNIEELYRSLSGFLRNIRKYFYEIIKILPNNDVNNPISDKAINLEDMIDGLGKLLLYFNNTDKYNIILNKNTLNLANIKNPNISINIDYNSSYFYILNNYYYIKIYCCMLNKQNNILVKPRVEPKNSFSSIKSNPSNNYNDNTNNESKYNIDNIDINSLNTCELINKYLDMNKQGSLLIQENKDLDAISYYEEAASIADELKDNFKKYESKCNLGIINYKLNNIQNAINLLQPCYKYFSDLCSSENNGNILENLTMLCKSGANLCMCEIALNNNDYCTRIIGDIINIISNEEDIYIQYFCLKYLNTILFCVNSLLFNKNKINSEQDQNDSSEDENQEDNNKTNQLLFESFNNFISTQNYESWINSLNALNIKMGISSNKQGLIKIIFNQQMAICLKNMENEGNNLNEENEEEAKLKLCALLLSRKQVTEEKKINLNNSNGNEIQINDEYINIIIEEYKNKLNNIKDIYNKLYSFEKQLNDNMRNNQNNSNIINMEYYKKNILKEKYNDDYNYEDELAKNKYFLILLLKYTINYFDSTIEDENTKNSLIYNIESAIYSINNPQISGLDFSNIDLHKLDPQLFNHVKKILMNLLKIYRLQKCKFVFDILKSTLKSNPKNGIILKSQKPKLNNNYKEKILEDFFQNYYLHIFNGELIGKINFRTEGMKNHYYQIDNDTDHFQCFDKQSSNKSKKEFDFDDDIIKIKIGITTKNLKNKIDIIESCSKNKSLPYMFMSFIINDKIKDKKDKLDGLTLDLMFNDEESAKSWFYGLYYYFVISKRPYKIMSCTYYILFRIKSKLIKKLNLNSSKSKKKKEINKNNTFAYYMKKFYNKHGEIFYSKLSNV